MLNGKLVIRAALAMVAGLGIATSSWAGQNSTNLAVTGSVKQNCTITTSAVAFGAYDPVGTNATSAAEAAGSVSIKCSKGSTGSIWIGLDTGANAGNAPVGSTRAMADGSNYLGYDLYLPSATTAGAACTSPYASGTLWGNTSPGLTPSGVTWSAKTASVFNICGSVPAAQDAVVGASYTDTVIAYINF